MTRTLRIAILMGACAASAAVLHAQGRGGGEWTASGYDAQRTAWLRRDERLTRAAVQDGEFKFLWKAKLENEPRQLNSLTTPILLDRLIGYRGFKSLAFIGGSSDRVFAIDTDLARPYWTAILNYSATTGGQPPSSWACPGGLIATLSRRTVLAPSTLGAGGGGGRAGARNGSAVGEPGRGAAVLSEPQPQRGRGGGAPGAPGAPGAAGQGGRAGGQGGRGVAPIPFGGVDPVFAVGSDGLLHTLLSSNGADAEPPVPFLPPHAKPSSLIWVDGVVYTSTSDGCGAAPNGVWAIDLTAKDKKPVTTWKTGGANVAGTEGPALGPDGTLYVSVGRGPAQGSLASTQPDARGADTSYSSAVVALDGGTLQPKDWFSAPDADFNSTPIVFKYKDKDLLAVTGTDGRLYVLDSGSLGGPDHKTPLAVTDKYTAAGAGVALATWEDQGTRWIFAPVSGAPQGKARFTANGLAPNGSIVAFKLSEDAGKVTLQPAWRSRDLISPLAPIVVDGMVFAVSSGEYRGTAAHLTAAQRAQRSVPAVLYAIDGATGKSLWGSGALIGSFARAGLSAGGGQLYVVTYDNHVYAFGIPMEH